MGRILTAVVALTLLSTGCMAQPNNYGRPDQNRDNDRRDDSGRNDQNRNNQNRNDQGRNDQNRNDRGRNDNAGNQDRQNNAGNRSPTPRWSRGDRLPDQNRRNQYIVNNWKQHNLKKPPRGYQWVMNDNRNYFLVVIGSGVIAESIYRDDRDHNWRQGYNRTYTYNDDIYYQECRDSPDPAGIILGGLIGGLLGSTAGSGGGRTGATIAGVVIGGAIGAALTNNLDCDDRSYAYRTYYDGFNSGRPNSRYNWRNPHNDHRGELRIGNYYDDPYGFRCANFSQIAYIQGRPQEVRGRACRQPDGTWAIVG